MRDKYLRFMQHWIEQRNKSWLGTEFQFPFQTKAEEEIKLEQERWKRIQDGQKKRGIIPLKAEAQVIALHQKDRSHYLEVVAYVEQKNVYQQGNRVYEERWQEWVPLRFKSSNNDWKISSVVPLSDPEPKNTSRILHIPQSTTVQDPEIEVSRYQPDRAVVYAEQYWNTNNPAFQTFSSNDCTNYVSQCLRAGGFPMMQTNRRDQGWWYRHAQSRPNDSWSYSWAVAHSFYHHLNHLSQAGKGVRRVSSAHELQLGDVLCYDFEGDGRWNHNTIVTMKDGDGAPLINAHTNNSQHRYWSYTDSAAYTDNIKYAFFHVER